MTLGTLSYYQQSKDLISGGLSSISACIWVNRTGRSRATLYQGTEHIGPRPFYEPPGTVLPKAASFGRAKRLSGTTMYRALRGLRIQPRAVLLPACIPDKLRGARDGETARVPNRTPCSWRRYQTNCSGRGYTEILCARIKGANREVSEGKLVPGHFHFSSYEGHKKRRTGKVRGPFKNAQGFGRLDAGSRAGFVTSRSPPPWTSVIQFFLFLYDVWP